MFSPTRTPTALVVLSLIAASSVVTGQTGEEARIKRLEQQIAELEAELARRSGPGDPTGPTAPATRLRWYEQHVAMKKASPHRDLPWHFLGPDNVSGRVTDVAVRTPRGRTYAIYAATASGGVWKTVNEGTTWEPIFEHAASTSIGDLTLDPSNPDVIWVGTGEANIFRSSMAGSGVYKSTDAGETWEHMGLAGTHTISRIVVHPDNPDMVYVASSGHEWTDDENRGVYRSTDGGETWDRVLYVNPRTGAIDLVMNPEDPRVLYAATWQRIRKRWNDPRNEPDYDGSGIWKTVDGGTTWTPINEGLPDAADRGRIGIDLCQASPDTLYAFVDCYATVDGPPPPGEDSYGRDRVKSIEGAQIYRSDDGGATWAKTSKSDRYMRRACSTYGWVFGQVRADPVDPDTVYMMGLSLNVSHDSGASFERLRGMHGDHHALWIDPANPDYLVNGNDGGIAISYDAGREWRTSRNDLPAVQFYNVGYDMESPFNVYGSIQDHGSRRGTVIIDQDRKRIRGRDWQGASGGEASNHAVTQAGERVLYSEGFYGSISRTDLETGERTRIKPKRRKGEPPLRGQWLAPFIISPHNPRIIYHGMNHLFRSLDRGDRWERISPDLSYGDATKLGDIPYQTIFSISESPHTFGLIYAGTDDGRLHRTRDSGRSWKEITAGLAPHRWIAQVEASRFTPGTLYVAQNGKRNDDFAAYLWRSTDRGDSWQDISTGIPGGPVNAIREDPEDASILYVGTDLGVYVTTDGAQTWNVLANGLPTTFVHDLVIHPRDDVMVIATHGRGMYAMDVRPLRRPAGTNADPGEDPGAGSDESARTGIRARYARANGLARRWRNKVSGARVEPHWFSNGTRFWYRRTLAGGGKEFLLVDAEAGKRDPAFDHDKLAATLAKATGKPTAGDKLPFDRIAFEGGTLAFEAEGRRWRYALTDDTCEDVGRAEAPTREARRGNPRRRGRRRRGGRSRQPSSPDGRWTLSVREHDLWVADAQAPDARRLTDDGTAQRPWEFLSWAPDSRTALVCRVDPAAPGELLNVETSAKPGDPAHLRRRPYARPGDKLKARDLHLVRVDGWKRVAIEGETIDFGPVRPRWLPDGSRFFYEKRDRGHQRSRVIEVDAHSGQTRVIIDESSKTFIDHYHKAWSRHLADTREILWASERDGWNHLYLYDANTGRVKTQVTKGPWVVRGVDRVDTDRRQVWFRASGFDEGQDPYLVHHFRVNLDGTGLVRLTEGNGDHRVVFSPDRRFLVDTYSRVDLPPVTQLRSGSDGSLICVLERADTTELEAAGWRAPESFVAKGRDGESDIWGIIVRPTDFDPKRSYPVIEQIYAGPHDSHVPKSFRAYRGVHALAELGFIVVQIDGMGTNNRSKEFHDVCWQNVGDAGLPDRRLWLKAAAERYPYMDLERVGIYGTSAGGQSALGALLFHGDFYKVAVASCGCHDNRIDKASWNEQWMGYPVGKHYEEQSNVTHAHRLEGKLMLIIGELSTNVPPESTYQVVDALIKADKDFDLIVIPGAGHTGGGRYGERRRRDFFVRHLLGLDPR